ARILLEHPAPPLLGALDLVEREDVKPGDVLIALPQVRGEPAHDLVRAVAAGEEEAPEHALLLLEEPRRRPQADPRRDPHQLLPVDLTGHTDPDRLGDALALQAAGPIQDRARVEADLGGH